jgi:hypothetical protein
VLKSSNFFKQLFEVFPAYCFTRGQSGLLAILKIIQSACRIWILGGFSVSIITFWDKETYLRDNRKTHVRQMAFDLSIIAKNKWVDIKETPIKCQKVSGDT